MGRRLLRIVAAACALLLLWQIWIFAQVLWWREVDPTSTRFMEIRLAELQEKTPTARLDHRWVPYERISTNLKRAVVAAEDDRFMSHAGFDWEGMQRALERNQRRGRTVSGGSTITQQLAKNLFLSPERSYLRKVQEAVITLMLEATWSKRRILEVYLNVVEWGDGLFGCEAAARRFHGVSCAQLGPAEAARLAVRLPSPRRYERQFGPHLSAHAAGIARRMGSSAIP